VFLVESGGDRGRFLPPWRTTYVYSTVNSDDTPGEVCKATKYRKKMLQCAYPTEDDIKESTDAANEMPNTHVLAAEKRARLFFSRRRLQELFTERDSQAIIELWDCKCNRCERSRREKQWSGTDAKSEWARISQSAWLLLALLVHLDRLHLIHYWVNTMGSREWNDRLSVGCNENLPANKKTTKFDWSFSQEQYDFFKRKCSTDWALFDPEIFKENDLGRIFLDHIRFPFRKMQTLRSSDVMHEITISEEYVDGWVKQRLQKYKDACLSKGASDEHVSALAPLSFAGS
jgi:hypothetical protein